MTASKAWARALEASKRAAGRTLPELLPSLASQFGDASALIDPDEEVSYRELDARVNRYARWAMAEALQAGDVVCLLLPNSADYLAVWLGLTRIGCIVALLNSHLPRAALEHCVRVAGSKFVISDPRLQAGVAGVAPVLDWAEIRARSGGLAADPLEVELPKPDDTALLIYTSGTTGLPKAANITHRRIVEWSFWFAGMMDCQPNDRLYDCLPMYHATGGIVATGAMLAAGGSVVIRPRFSATHFWDDICDNGCTIFQYIGELCRYLTQTGPHSREGEHRLRLACGNGMQGAVWKVFQERFSVPQVLEFYAATEGNLSLYNCEGKPGAIGRIPSYLARQFAVRLIRIDPETGAPIRNADGFSVICAGNEAGEAISLMQGRGFDGYTDAEASERKILRDVFAVGDAWFRSGDLMRRDRFGFFYFVDRLGDTFRWKGENVSTTEVANVLLACDGIEDVVVYGVPVHGVEGRAGMAALVVNKAFDFSVFETYLTQNLPEYARPVFVRLCPVLAVTGTLKLTKADLVQDGLEKASDQIWQRDRHGVFCPFNPRLRQALLISAALPAGSPNGKPVRHGQQPP